MKYEKYDLETDSRNTIFEFTSIGRNGEIRKQVQYAKTNTSGVFNLGFGDKDMETGQIDDLITSNNGDSEKVLATVASTIHLFFEKEPEAKVYIEGSDPVRTRRYRMAITNNLLDLNKEFIIYGSVNNKWQMFSKNVEYEAFLIQKKN